MKLITEEISNAEYIVEEKNGKKNYAIKGIFMQSNTGQVLVSVHRGPNDADADTLVGSIQLRSQGDSVILEKHPTDVLVFDGASAVKVGRVGP